MFVYRLSLHVELKAEYVVNIDALDASLEQCCACAKDDRNKEEQNIGIFRLTLDALM